MKSKMNLLIFAGAVMLCILQCANHDVRSRDSNRNLNNATSTFIYNAIPPGAHDEVSVEYSRAINTFSVNLLNTVYTTSDFLGKNLILSPFSVSRNLAVLADASSGQTRQEMLDVLGGQKALDDARTALGELLYADKSVVFQCADAIWVNSTMYSIVETFRDTAQYKYGVKTAELNFDDASAAATTINGWVNQNTNYKISSIVEPGDFSGITAAVVANAVYFEADWTSPFDVTKTHAQTFTSPDGPVMVDMMESDYRHDTYKTDTYENAKLYYGTNSADYFYLDLYMPKSMSIEQFLRDSCLAALSRHDSTSRGSVQIPKFFFTTRCDLIPVLKTLGVHRAFDPVAAEITGMVRRIGGGNQPLYIMKMIQQAGIKTNEEGTEAYAATVSIAGTTSAAPPSPDVVFDKPFVYFIRAGKNGLVLFSGVVSKPI
jgi:serpin B